MQLIRLIMCMVVMGSMLNVMAMETEIIQQKRAAAVAKYKETKRLISQRRQGYSIAYQSIDRPLGGTLYMGVSIITDFELCLPEPLFDEGCIQDVSLVKESDSQEEKDKALCRLVNICRQGFYKHGETLINAIKSVVGKGADPNLENDIKYVGYPLYIALKKEKNDDLLQLLFAHGAHTDLSKAAVWVREVFEEYNKNQEKLKK